MLTTFLLASSLITLMPGPSMILVIINSIEGGFKQGMLSVAGVVIADVILLGVVLSGVGAIVGSSALLFNVIKLSGSLYLIYLGVGLGKNLSTEDGLPPCASTTPFSSAVNMTLLNPKIIIFLIAFFPQFIDLHKPLKEQMLLLCSLFLAVVCSILTLYSLAALKLRTLFQTKKGMRVIKLVTAISLISCGIMMGIGGQVLN
jgi:threonine/homoserine/homoserine lactone efflux protein